MHTDVINPRICIEYKYTKSSNSSFIYFSLRAYSTETRTPSGRSLLELMISDWLRLRVLSEMLSTQAPSRPVVLNLGSIEPQRFGESVSGVRR